MAILAWVRDNGFIFEAVGVVASLLFSGIALVFTCLAYRKDTLSRNLEYVFKVNEAHREIWSGLLKSASAKRILSPEVDLESSPLNTEEIFSVNPLILHLGATFRALRSGLYTTDQKIEDDIRWFFALPIPAAVWQKSKKLQEPAFVKFVDSALAESNGRADASMISEVPSVISTSSPAPEATRS